MDMTVVDGPQLLSIALVMYELTSILFKQYLSIYDAKYLSRKPTIGKAMVTDASAPCSPAS